MNPNLPPCQVFKEPPAKAQLPGDEWCWVANSVDVSLSDSPVADVRFDQSGFRFYLKSQVEDTLSLVSEEETRALEIKVRGVEEWREGVDGWKQCTANS